MVQYFIGSYIIGALSRCESMQADHLQQQQDSINNKLIFHIVIFLFLMLCAAAHPCVYNKQSVHMRCAAEKHYSRYLANPSF